MTLNLAANTRYTPVAIALHWILAVLALGQVFVGWWMGDAVLDPATRAQALQVFPLHKATGITVLALTVVRILWRLAHRPPPLPHRMAPWEKFLAQATHAAFYLLLLALPLSGWIYASAGYSEAFKTFIRVPLSYFGLFTVPDIPGIATQPDEARKAIGLTAINVHSKLAWAMLLLAGLHVAAAVKHHIADRDDVLTRMLPFLKPRKIA
jgi:cytochrome b561